MELTIVNLITGSICACSSFRTNSGKVLKDQLNAYFWTHFCLWHLLFLVSKNYFSVKQILMKGLGSINNNPTLQLLLSESCFWQPHQHNTHFLHVFAHTYICTYRQTDIHTYLYTYINIVT